MSDSQKEANQHTNRSEYNDGEKINTVVGSKNESDEVTSKIKFSETYPGRGTEMANTEQKHIGIIIPSASAGGAH